MAGDVGQVGAWVAGAGTGVGAGSGSGAGVGGREDTMDAALAMLTHLMERMDTTDTWQAAIGEELRAFYAAAPAGPACAAVAHHTGTRPAPWAPCVHPPTSPSEPSEEDSSKRGPVTRPGLDERPLTGRIRPWGCAQRRNLQAQGNGTSSLMINDEGIHKVKGKT